MSGTGRPSRRELLASFLGVPALLAGCEGGATPDLPEGELVGPSHELGHLLRDGFRPEVPPEQRRRVPVVIVGGGVSGLAAAWRFRRAGFDEFVLLELEPEVGGTSRGGRSSVVGYPWGAHYVPAPMRENRTLITLLSEMGVLDGEDDSGQPVVREEYLCRDPQERVFFRGRWYEGLYLRSGATPDDLAQLARFRAEIGRWVAWRDSKGRRAFGIPTASASNDTAVTELDRLTMAEWLDEHPG